MQTTESDRRQIALAQEYFRRVDAGRADLTDLMTEDVELYFPKFGIGRSKGAFGEFATVWDVSSSRSKTITGPIRSFVPELLSLWKALRVAG